MMPISSAQKADPIPSSDTPDAAITKVIPAAVRVCGSAKAPEIAPANAPSRATPATASSTPSPAASTSADRAAESGAITR
ncbi:hypothetical protein GCM10027169_29450 [Gordonia jinhuaensis]|uniref:Uncharacterized protein n=1 Tax=Gordonia jinhuaensis TaxID=1517702 RepID=A0A916T8G3_9ACTN|nr:hypothetical protein GCM10011489_24670 [Gordonia jinhuaensis]